MAASTNKRCRSILVATWLTCSENAPVKDVTAEEALAALIRWGNGRTMALLGALLENDSVKIHASLSEAYQARADKILKAEANAANAAVAQEKQAA